MVDAEEGQQVDKQVDVLKSTNPAGWVGNRTIRLSAKLFFGKTFSLD